MCLDLCFSMPVAFTKTDRGVKFPSKTMHLLQILQQEGSFNLVISSQAVWSNYVQFYRDCQLKKPTFSQQKLLAVLTYAADCQQCNAINGMQKLALVSHENTIKLYQIQPILFITYIQKQKMIKCCKIRKKQTSKQHNKNRKGRIPFFNISVQKTQEICRSSSQTS